jgi:hypothetical protein
MRGENLMGKILMEIRDKHRNKEASDRTMSAPSIFISGSRSIAELSPPIRARIDNIVNKGFSILIGDASGADRTVQQYLANKGYPSVTVFCTGACRNNIGWWETKVSYAKAGQTGFEFYKLKDEVMARKADYGFMLWDGKQRNSEQRFECAERRKKLRGLLCACAKTLCGSKS